MRAATINTSNNVRISYDLATTQQRIMAFFIDLVILAVYILILEMLNPGNVATNMLLSLPILCYTLLFEFFTGGQTPGKMAMNIKVIKVDGRPASFNDFFQRWLFRLLEIWLTAGAMATIMVSASDRGQRIGDALAQTMVISTSAKYKISVSDLTAMKAGSGNTDKYKVLLAYTDQDMMILKTAVDRFHQFPNKAHREVVEQLAARVSEQTGLKWKDGAEPKAYLKQVLQEYIVLTRA